MIRSTTAIRVVLSSMLVFSGENARAQVSRSLDADGLRDAVAGNLRTASISVGAAETAYLTRAKALAARYTARFQDRFLERDVARFTNLSRAARRHRVVADSLRRDGIAALTTRGVPSAMQLWRSALVEARKSADESAIAPILVAIGGGYYRGQQYDSAEAYLKSGLTLSRRIDDLRSSGNALGILGSIAKERGDSESALRLYREAAVTRRRIGDERGLASDNNNIGLIAREAGDFERATKAFTSALEANRSLGLNSAAALNLSNLAGVASDISDFRIADSLYKKALTIQAELGEKAEAAFVLHDFGRLQMRRGDYAGAMSSLSESVKYHEESGAVVDAAKAGADLASVQASAGRLVDAQRTLRHASFAARGVLDPSAQAMLRMVGADISLAYGDLTGAERAYNESQQLFALSHDTRGEEDAAYGRATVLYEAQRYRESLELLQRTRHRQLDIRDRRAAALTQLLMGSIQQNGGDLASASASLRSARSVLAAMNDRAGEAAALELLGNVAVEAGQLKPAKAYYTKGLAIVGGNGAHDVRWRLHAGLGRALRNEGHLDSAASEFRIAIDMIELLGTMNRTAPQRWRLLDDKWSTYLDLSSLEQQRRKSSDAFAVSEQLRARETVDLLSRGATVSVGSATQRERDLSIQIAELTREIDLSASMSPRRRDMRNMRLSALRDRLARAQREYSRAATSFITAAGSSNVDNKRKLINAAVVSSHLASDELLLEYLLGDSSCVVFAVTPDSVTVVPLALSRDALVDIISFTRRAVERRNNGSNDLWAPPLRRLYRELITPVETRGLLRGKTKLILVPHRELHYLSFAALVAPDDRFLVERFQLSYAPSAAAWLELQDRRPSPVARHILAFAPFAGKLPGSKREVNAIRSIYGRRVVLRVGRDASKNELTANLAKASIVHLATFGILNRMNPLFSYVGVSGPAGESGRLEVKDIFSLGLRGQVVILSACETAGASGPRGGLPAGDEWVGMVSAFLQGGARSVTASLWPVDDQVTASLMTRFHRRLAAGAPAATAMAMAQRETLQEQRTHDPFYWAAFAVNGNGGS